MRLGPSDNPLPPEKPEPSPPLPGPPEESNGAFLSGYRERIMYSLAYVIALLVTPFSINDFIQGRYALGIVILTVVLAFGVNAFAIHFKRRPPIPFAFLLAPVVASIGLSLATQGVNGALWCYPGVLLCFFVLSRPMAIASSIALLALASPMVYVALGTPVAIRFVASMGVTIAVIAIITDVISALQRELTDQAVTDPLTGAFNRRQMETSLAEAVERNQRTGAPATALVIDIDHFKRVNDQLGHPTGDRVLKELVKLIGTRVRKTDKLFRMGGEEFLLLLPDTAAASAMVQAESLRGRVAESGILKNRPVTISIGVADHQPGQTVDDWVKRADTALYQAKDGGRNRVVCNAAAKPVSAPA